MSLACPVAPVHRSSSEERLPSRLVPPHRPSAMRNSSSDHIITPAVTRFDPKTADIPPSPTFNPGECEARAAKPDSSTASSLDPPSTLDAPTSVDHSSRVPPPPALAHRSATAPVGTPLRSASTSPKPTTSLLARRRSSRSTARPDFLPKIDDLKLPTIPIPPLEELDDTVVPDVIGVSSQATTPFAVSPTAVDLEEAPFKPTKSYASTPFPSKGRRQSFFDESEDEEDKEDGDHDRDSLDSDDEDADGRSTAESSILDDVTDGTRRLSMSSSSSDTDHMAKPLS
ncbi:uncharacterized protein JCM15063_001277 [Sporobolomyces koalae]|uniref:uncharacterized protein n=1 Tax=Sporobolomyces koalae TaxID=500713 RepID=UPI0031737674